MSTQIQYRRGSSAQTASFAGALGELTVDTTNRVVVVHDGATLGGFPLVGLTASQTLTNKTLSGAVLTSTLTANGAVGSSGQYLESTGTGTRWSTIDATSIQSGTSSMTVISSGGSIRANVGGATNTTFTSTEANVSANLTCTAQTGLGTAPTTAAVTIGGNETASSWTTSGIGLRINAATYTDSSTAAAGTAATNHIHAIGQGTLAATNGGVTTTEAASLYIAGAPVAGTNMTITNSYALEVANGNVQIDTTSAATSATTGALRVAGGVGVNGNIFTAGVFTVNSGAAATAIVNGASNGVGNIGSSTTGFNTIFAKSTSAQYADVAERYLADADYPVGTVLIIGGDKEVTQSNMVGQTSIAGTVSENPGVLMNRGLEGEHVVAVALLGRVPCRVIGPVNKGDLLMSSEISGVACKMENYAPGCVIGKALESHSTETEGIIEIMVGRL